MRMVEIARFSNETDADLAVSFLWHHGLRTVIPRRNSTWAHCALGEFSIFGDLEDAEEARGLFRRVLTGEFSDHDPTEHSGKGLGAALSQAILPAPGYKRPSILEAIAPFLVLAGLFALTLLLNFLFAR